MSKLKWICSIAILSLASAGCELTTGFIYENRISDTQSVKTTIELKKIQIGGK